MKKHIVILFAGMLIAGCGTDFRGRGAPLILHDKAGHIESVRLYSVRDSAFMIYKTAGGIADSLRLAQIRNDDVQYFVKEADSKIFPMLGGGVLGGLTGFVAATSLSWKTYCELDICYSGPSESAMIGGSIAGVVIGAGIGYFLTSPAITFQPKIHEDIERLRELSAYPSKEPDWLKKIK